MERDQDENAPANICSLRTFYTKSQIFSNPQWTESKGFLATFRRNLRIVARLICYSCFSRLMRLRQSIQTYMQKTHLLSACFEECLHSNSCQPSAMRRISRKLFAEGCEKALSRCLKLAKGTGILPLKQT